MISSCSTRLRKIVSLLLFLAVSLSAALAQSFTVSAVPNSITIHPGDQNVPVTVSVASGTYTGLVNITLTGLPSGISVSPLTLNAGGSGTLYLSASVSADREAFPASDPANGNTVTSTVELVGIAGSTVVSSPMTLVVSLSNPAFAPDPDKINLPIVRIDTGGVAIVSKDIKVPGTITITSADGQTQYLPNSSDSDTTATFHVHGNSTAAMPKLTYNVKLNTSLDLLNTMGMNCPYVTGSGKPTCDKSKSYILLANYDDKTFLRDWAASALANAIPIGNGYLNSPPNSPTPSGTSTLMPWAPHSLFVELYLNGTYEGTYQLIEKMNVDSHRINISELSETDTTDVTGGYLLQIDARQGEAFNFITPRILAIGLEDPDFSPDPEVPQQTSYISKYVTDAEYALFSVPFTDPKIGWRAYFDEASAVNFYIVNDLMGNVDGGDFYSSDYFYKDKDNPLLYMGPVWDFDISSGNVNYMAITNPTIPWMQTQSLWYRQWFRDPGFKADVATQWNALKNNGVFATWLASIDQEAASLQQAQANNFGRWPMQGVQVWPNPEAAGSYSGEVSYLTNWINLRIGYLDSLFNNKAQTSTILTVPSGTLRQGTAVALSANVTGGTAGSAAPTGNVSFMAGSVVLGTGPLDGNGSASLTTSNLPAGTVNLEAVYNGDSSNGLSASSIAPVTVLAPLLPTTTALTSSATNVNPQAPTNLTIVVLGNSGTGSPTGTVSFSANGRELGTAAVGPGGVATYSPTQLPAGIDTLQASYGGDTVYQASSSNTATVTVAAIEAPVFSLPAGTYTSTQTVTMTDDTPGATIYYTTDGSLPTASSTAYTGAISIPATQTLQAIAILPNYAPSAITTAIYTIPPDYTLAVSPASLILQQGQTGSTTITLTPVGDYHGAVNFSCADLPVNTICTFAPGQIELTGNNQPANVTLTLQTNVQSAAMRATPSPMHGPLNPIFPTLAFLWPTGMVGITAFGSKRKSSKAQQRGFYLCLLLVAAGVFAVGMVGCGNSNSSGSSLSPVGSSTVMVKVSAVSGGTITAHTANFNVTIQP